MKFSTKPVLFAVLGLVACAQNPLYSGYSTDRINVIKTDSIDEVIASLKRIYDQRLDPTAAVSPASAGPGASALGDSGARAYPDGALTFQRCATGLTQLPGHPQYRHGDFDGIVRRRLQ